VRQKTFKKIEKNETKNPKKIAKLEKKKLQKQWLKRNL